MLRSVVITCGLALASLPLSASAEVVLQATSYDEFAAQFCAADRGVEHIFVLPGAVFGEQTKIDCDDGESQLRLS
jgi:hypothetical protein